MGIYKIRNCLAHRLGVVGLEDVKPRGKGLSETTDEDKLTAIWVRLRAVLNGKEITAFPCATPDGGTVDVQFEPYKREWKIGEQIEITPQECQFIAASLSMLGNRLLVDFESEMNELLGIRKARGSST